MFKREHQPTVHCLEIVSGAIGFPTDIISVRHYATRRNRCHSCVGQDLPIAIAVSSTTKFVETVLVGRGSLLGCSQCSTAQVGEWVYTHMLGLPCTSKTHQRRPDSTIRLKYCTRLVGEVLTCVAKRVTPTAPRQVFHL